jgi:hypothetical protein
LLKDSKLYDSGVAPSYWQWIGKFANQSFDYFAKHTSGTPIAYKFNSLGYRGPEHYDDPDISVFGSSFSFGVGIEFQQCWHQLLGNYRINCYAPAGIGVTNNDIIEHYYQAKISISIPQNVDYFIIDSYRHSDLFGFAYSSIIDLAEDKTHPGPNTHKLWAYIIKKKFNL